MADRKGLVPVTQAEALTFVESALRHWTIKGFNTDDLEDLREGLQLFAARHRADALTEALRVVREAREALEHIECQAGNAGHATAGCATTHGDPGGGLEEANRYVSDIAANASILCDRLNVFLAQHEGERP